jgi:hypothetical protein
MSSDAKRLTRPSRRLSRLAMLLQPQPHPNRQKRYIENPTVGLHQLKFIFGIMIVDHKSDSQVLKYSFNTEYDSRKSRSILFLDFAI